jgi:dihydrofolate reductase
MRFSLIAALDAVGTIGSADGGLPWDFPKDREHFRSTVRGRAVLVGYRTYQEMEHWFGSEEVFVLTRSPDAPLFQPGHHRIGAVEDAQIIARNHGLDEVFVIGGGTTFAACLPFCDRLILTRLAEVFPVRNAISFPGFEASPDWYLEQRDIWPPSPGQPCSARLEIWIRRKER